MPDVVVLLVLTLRVEEPEPVTEVGLKLALAPVGRPPALKLTVPVKPFNAVTLAVYVVFEPWVTVREDGVADNEKALTTRVTVVVLIAWALLPVIVSGYVPAGVEVLVGTLSVVDPEVVRLEGLNDAVAPVGSPLTLKLTVPVNPFSGVSVML